MSFSTKAFLTKRNLFIVILILLLAGGIWFYREVQDPAPPILRALYPHFHIEKLPDDPHHYTFGNYDGFEFDFYAKEITVGNAPFFLTVENKPNQRSIYRFYAIGLDPEPVMETEWGLPVSSSEDAFEKNLTYDDLTGDGVAELLVRTRSEENHLSYIFLKERDRSLRPISLGANFEDWINVKYLGREGDAIYFVTATSDDPLNETYDESFRQKYFLQGDMLVSEGDVETQEQVEAFANDISLAIEDPAWSALALAFNESCESLPGSVLNPEGLPFRQMVQSLEPVKVQSDGSQVYILPCMLHAYQSSQMPAILSGGRYEPILIHQMDYDKNRTESYTTVELGYEPARDLFSSYGKGRGMGDCGAGYEYTLVGKELVLQKFEADKECDGEYESEVIFDSTR